MTTTNRDTQANFDTEMMEKLRETKHNIQRTIITEYSDANGSPITLYNVYQSENSGAYVLKGSSATNAFQATGLSMGSNFKFQVVAINAAGSGQISEESDFLIAATVPDKPTLLTRISADRTKITIGW